MTFRRVPNPAIGPRLLPRAEATSFIMARALAVMQAAQVSFLC
jgi:hypothetical protein